MTGNNNSDIIINNKILENNNGVEQTRIIRIIRMTPFLSPIKEKIVPRHNRSL